MQLQTMVEVTRKHGTLQMLNGSSEDTSAVEEEHFYMSGSRTPHLGNLATTRTQAFMHDVPSREKIVKKMPELGTIHIMELTVLRRLWATKKARQDPSLMHPV